VDWHSIHVYYHDDNKDRLILDAVRPLFKRLASAASWTRHWRQGPHLRLTFRSDVDTTLPLAEEVVGGWLAEHPSTTSLDPDSLLPAHRLLAMREREQGPLTPWPPNNSLRVAEYDRRVAVLGNEDMADLLADFYADTTPMSFAMVEAEKRLMLAFDLVVATAHTQTTGIQHGFVALRSHAEAFLNGHPDSGKLRPRWDEHYQRHADSLAARLRGVVATLDGDHEAVPFVRDWARVLGTYRARAENLLAEGRFFMPTANFSPESGLAQNSRFHRALVAGPRWSEMGSSTTFALFRLMANYTYLQLTRLGVTPDERFLLCHLAANAVEDQYGVSALDLVTKGVPS